MISSVGNFLNYITTDVRNRLLARWYTPPYDNNFFRSRSHKLNYLSSSSFCRLCGRYSRQLNHGGPIVGQFYSYVWRSVSFFLGRRAIIYARWKYFPIRSFPISPFFPPDRELHTRSQTMIAMIPVMKNHGHWLVNEILVLLWNNIIWMKARVPCILRS